MAIESRLFSRLVIGRVHVRNRIAFESAATDLTRADGHTTQELCTYYAERARQGAALIITAPFRINPPDTADPTPHLGLYADDQTASLGACVEAIHIADAAALVMLDEPMTDEATLERTQQLARAYVLAARRAYDAGADGVMLSVADGGLLQQLCAPPFTDGRFARALKIVELHRQRLGRGFLLGVRLCVDEMRPAGLSLHDARVVARRLSSAGVNLIEIQVSHTAPTPVAQFPGWCVPVAAAVKAVIEVPVMVGGLLDDPIVAESVINDGAADLVALGERLRQDPGWPSQARATLGAVDRD
jgi:2,4-dienoyl-CoA reductase-like NADH-dependent reductase (Old Yellow Enzyme family)